MFLDTQAYRQANKQTDKHTDTLITIFRTPTGGKVTTTAVPNNTSSLSNCMWKSWSSSRQWKGSEFEAVVGNNVDETATVGWAVIVRVIVIDWPNTDELYSQPPEIHTKFKLVRQWGLTSIHTCRFYVHTPRDFTNGASLARRVTRARSLNYK